MASLSANPNVPSWDSCTSDEVMDGFVSGGSFELVSHGKRPGSQSHPAMIAVRFGDPNWRLKAAFDHWFDPLIMQILGLVRLASHRQPPECPHRIPPRPGSAGECPAAAAMRIRGLGSGLFIPPILTTLVAGAGPRLRGEEPVPALLQMEETPADFKLEFFPKARLRGQRPLVLALGGGAAKGIAHLGILQRLQEEGLPVDAIAGTSMGAFVGSMYASGYSGFAVQEMLESLDMGAMLLDRQLRAPGEPLSEQEHERAPLLNLEFKHGEGLTFGQASKDKLWETFSLSASFPAGGAPSLSGEATAQQVEHSFANAPLRPLAMTLALWR